MPAENTYDESTEGLRVKVAWGVGDVVQVAALNGDEGFYVSLSDEGVDRVIKALRRAKRRRHKDDAWEAA